jgi:bifunctional enzyme CysN/CysC
MRRNLPQRKTRLNVAEGMVPGVPGSVPEAVRDGGTTHAVPSKSPDTVWRGWNIPREVREERNGHSAVALWFTGYSGAGKSTIAGLLERRLFDAGYRTMLLDGDQIRHGLSGDLGFSERDRQENIRRAGEVARLFFEAGHIVICAFISPFIRDRQFVRSLFPEGGFLEVYVRCNLDTCIGRDPHGLYKRAIAGQIAEFTGISSPYEEPPWPEIVVETDLHGPDEICDFLMRKLVEEGIVSPETIG